MARHRRNDAPDTWHHVYNRGLARRTLFESDRDVRFFLSRVARAVHAGKIEVHAYCVLTTHFHLLVRSRTGELSEVLQRIQNDYSRWFNRGRGRDGPLYQGRFKSKRANALDYREQLVRYIDFNPVAAGLAATPALHPHGSARRYAAPSGPIWLERSWVEGTVRRWSEAAAYAPADYARWFGRPLPDRLARLVELRIARSNDGEDPLGDLLDAAPPSVLAWMRARAALADGTEVGVPVCDSESVDELVRLSRERPDEGGAIKGWGRGDPLAVLHVALLRDLCGATLREIGARTGSSAQVAWKRYVRHQRAIAEVPDYAARCAHVAARALRRCHRADAAEGAEVKKWTGTVLSSG